MMRVQQRSGIPACASVNPGPVRGHRPVPGRCPGLAVLFVSRAMSEGRGELVLVLALLALGLLLRVPHFLDLPPFTDETEEAIRALAIARGELLPITNVDPYISALKNYVDAAGFLLLGPNPAVPRLVSLVAALLTIVASYHLGRELDGRGVAAITGLLVATSSLHIAVNSHIGWSNCITPLFSTASFALLLRAERRRQPALLLPASALLGGSLLTHPSALLLVPGAVAALLLSPTRSAWLRPRWAVWAALAGTAVVSPLLLYTLLSGFVPIQGALAVQASYMRRHPVDLDRYPLNLARLAEAVARAVIGELREPPPGSLVGSPWAMAAGLLALAALVLAWRRGTRLPLAVTLPFLLLMPLLNAKYSLLLNGRYFAPLLPLLFAVIAVAALRSPRSPRLAVLTALLLVAGLTSNSLWSLQGYYAQAWKLGEQNRRLLALSPHLQAIGHQQPQARVLVEQGLHSISLAGGGRVLLAVRYLCVLATLDCTAADVSSRERLEGLLRGGWQPQWAILRRPATRRVAQVMGLQPGPVGEKTNMAGSDYWLYRLEPGASR